MCNHLYEVMITGVIMTSVIITCVIITVIHFNQYSDCTNPYGVIWGLWGCVYPSWVMFSNGIFFIDEWKHFINVSDKHVVVHFDVSLNQELYPHGFTGTTYTISTSINDVVKNRYDYISTRTISSLTSCTS